MDNNLDIAQLKYVLYARKSTTDETRQVRSIPDQISDCKLYAAGYGLNIVRILRETQSAKKPNQRPIFRQMINDIKRGVYDGILAWNPDRLARNMLEGGEIIDLIDQGVIKDLKFKTHTFTNDANGKMLLGMAFVLSKQYSDDLSQKVTRGVRSRLSEGRTPTPKHGYINESGIYSPDGKNFELIVDAWEMRKEGKPIESITKYMNQNGYSRIIKRNGKQVDMDKRILSKILHDPFYYGMLVQAGQQVDLRQIYDFIPAVNEEDYFTVQQLDYRKIRPSTPHKTAFYPLRRIVLCHYCGSPCVVAPSTGHIKTNRYLYYRCDDQGCIRNSPENKAKHRSDPTKIKTSIRSKVVFDFVYAFLRNGLNFTEKEYHEYYDNLILLTDQRRQEVRAKLLNLRGVLKKVKQDIEERSLRIVNYDIKSQIWKINNNKIAELADEQAKLEEAIEKTEQLLREPETDRLTIEQFLNLSKNAVNIVQSANAVDKDQIVREVFLNLSIDDKKVASYRLKEPFATLLKQRQVLPSRDLRKS